MKARADKSTGSGPLFSFGFLQRKCACRSHDAAGECAQCRKKQLHRHAEDQAEPCALPPIVHELWPSPGQPPDPATRAFPEPPFGHDFSQVHVHSAHASNEEMPLSPTENMSDWPRD